MPIIVEAVATDGFLEWLPKYLGGVGTGAWVPTPLSFAVGTGGWFDPGTSVLRPAIPDPSRTALAKLPPPGSPYLIPGWATTKLLAAPDFAYTSPGILETTCFLNFAEGNAAGNIDYWEIGLFGAAAPGTVIPLMLVYGTFPKVTKSIAVTRQFIVRTRFAR